MPVSQPFKWVFIQTTTDEAPTDLNFKHSELLRFITAGSVDDGKSTSDRAAAPRFQSRSFEDQLAGCGANRRAAEASTALDLSLLTDGLASGAGAGHHHRRRLSLFRHAQRKFIIADTPGHEQDTRNMVTGRFDGESGRHFHRRAQRGDPRNRAVTLTLLSRSAFPVGGRREQDGSGELFQ